MVGPCRRRLIVSLALIAGALLVLAGPAAAEDAAAVLPAVSFAAPAAEPGCLPGDTTGACAPVVTLAGIFQPAFLAKKGDAPPEPGEAGVTTVDCWDGSQRTCTGSTTYGTDSSCPGQRGYCYGSTTGYLYCPVCPSQPCSATASCSSGSVSCTGGPGCFAVNGCYAYCDDTYHMCSNPAPNCPF